MGDGPRTAPGEQVRRARTGPHEHHSSHTLRWFARAPRRFARAAWQFVRGAGAAWQFVRGAGAAWRFARVARRFARVARRFARAPWQLACAPRELARAGSHEHRPSHTPRRFARAAWQFAWGACGNDIDGPSMLF